MKNCIVIGGGIIGLCTAYYLQKEGHSVTVIDQSNMDSGASYVNAGYLSPSHIIPLSAPGVMKKGLRWMFNSKSPLYIKPRLEKDFLRWVWAFNRSCNPRHVAKAVPVIKDISLLSQELFDEIKEDPDFTFHYKKKGLLMLCRTDKLLEEEISVSKLAKDQGLEVRTLSLAEVAKMEPNVNLDIRGAIYYDCDYHTTPHELMRDLKQYLKKAGVVFCKNEKVEDLTLKGHKIDSISTSKQKYNADEFVLASGTWSPILSKKIGLKLLMQAGKGYRIDTKTATGITIPAILAEAKIAVTPMHGFTRLAGTMEIAGINHTINASRVEAISEVSKAYYPDLILSQEEKKHAACGLRPVSPDGLPYIGRSKKCKNLTLASGHAMMGWTMSTATGKLISEIVSEIPPSLSLEMFSPDRKF